MWALQALGVCGDMAGSVLSIDHGDCSREAVTAIAEMKLHLIADRRLHENAINSVVCLELFFVKF